MKEDILEQLVDGYLLRKPATFTKHNVKFKPEKSAIAHLAASDRNKYSVPSDIDVLGIHLKSSGSNRVSAISCKSWQGGFDVDFWYDHLTDPIKKSRKFGTSEAWKKFRELSEPIWAKAFRDRIYQETGSTSFDYYIAVTKLKNINAVRLDDFKTCPQFISMLSDEGKHDVTINFLTLEDMLREIFQEKSSTTLEATEIGRFIQLIRAANLNLEFSTNLKDREQ